MPAIAHFNPNYFLILRGLSNTIGMLLFLLLNIVSFIDVVIIIVVVYYGFKIVMRIVAPKIVEKAADKIFQEMKNGEASKGRTTVRQGDLTIDYSNKKPKQYRRADGDYIEFEEIDDKKNNHK